jgi:hypothetical protein
MPTPILPAWIVFPRGRLLALTLGLAAFALAAAPLGAKTQPKPVQSDHKESGLDQPKLPEPKHTTKRTPKSHVNSEEEAQKHLREREASKHPKPKKTIQRETPPRVTPPHPPAAHPGVPK